MEKAAFILAKQLKEKGIEYAFGIPGGEVLEILKAFRAVGIKFILTKHEMGAGFMADAYYQLTGKPGVLVATLGPGLTNTVTPVANAFLERSALVVITGEVDTKLSGIYTHQVLEQQNLLKPITKWSTTLSDGSASHAIQKAINISLSGIPGPVHLNIPTNIARMEQPLSIYADKLTLGNEPSKEAVHAFITNLEQAKKPIILAGVNLSKEDAALLSEFCMKWNIPVITTYKAKGVVSEDQIFCFGGAGLSPVVDKLHMSLLNDQADLIITIGFDPVELRSDWNLAWKTKTVNIDTIPNQNQLIPVHEEYVGNIGSFFRKIIEWEKQEQKWPNLEMQTYKNEISNLVKPKQIDGLSPYHVIQEARKTFPKETIATVDTGSHRILFNQVWQCFHPKELLQSNGLGTMAYSLPAAISAQLTYPNRKVVAFMGDAGLDMITGEMALLHEHQLPVTMIVFRDNALSLIQLKQQRLGYEEFGVSFCAPAYDKLAEAYGGMGFIVETMGELQAALEESLISRSFVLIEARINASEYRNQM